MPNGFAIPSHFVEFVTTAPSKPTLPTTGTLATVAGTETLTNKTLTSPLVTQASEAVTTTNAITAAESGSVFFLNSATPFASTLPAPAAGLNFEFIVSTAPSGGNHTIVTTSSANIIKGHIVSADLDAASDGDIETSGGDRISFVNAKAVAGDRVVLRCDGTNWFAYGSCSVFDAIIIEVVS